MKKAIFLFFILMLHASFSEIQVLEPHDLLLDFPEPSLSANSYSFNPGERVNFIATLKKSQELILAEPSIKIGIFYSSEAFFSDYLVEEIEMERTAIFKDKTEFSAEWLIPRNAPKGNYYFVPLVSYSGFSKEKNVHSHAGFDSNYFWVKGSATLPVSLDLAESLGLTELAQGTKEASFIVQTPKNTEMVFVKAEVFESQFKANSEPIQKKTMMVKAGKLSSISFTDLGPGNYTVKITARNGTWQQIKTIKFSSFERTPEVSFMGVKSQKNSQQFFACFRMPEETITGIDINAAIQVEGQEGNALSETAVFSADSSAKCVILTTEKQIGGIVEFGISFSNLNGLKIGGEETIAEIPSILPTPKRTVIPTPTIKPKENFGLGGFILIALILVVLLTLLFSYLNSNKKKKQKHNGSIK